MNCDVCGRDKERNEKFATVTFKASNRRLVACYPCCKRVSVLFAKLHELHHADAWQSMWNEKRAKENQQ